MQINLLLLIWPVFYERDLYLSSYMYLANPSSNFFCVNQIFESLEISSYSVLYRMQGNLFLFHYYQSINKIYQPISNNRFKTF